MEILEYPPPPPPVAFAVVPLADLAAPAEPPAPMTSIIFAALFQSDGTVHEVPDVRNTVTAVKTGPPSSARGAAANG